VRERIDAGAEDEHPLAGIETSATKGRIGESEMKRTAVSMKLDINSS
jgi:hypothetical protein